MTFNPAHYLNRSSRNLGEDCCVLSTDTSELTFNPKVLFFSYLVIGGESDPLPFTITNTGTLPVGIAAISVTGDFELTGTAPAIMNPGDIATFQIVFKPTADGARIGDVLIDTGDGACNCVHVIGIGGTDELADMLAGINAQLAAVEAVNTAQQTQINTLLGLLEGYVSTTPVYMWRAYGNSPDGHTDFSTSDANDRTYIGLAFNKFSPTPSEDPEDYVWSFLGVSMSNVFSWDTTYVAGVPSTQIVSDLTDLSLQLLAYQFDRQQLRDYVDALLYQDGVPIATVITTLRNQVTTDTEALAEELHVLGAKTPDGLSFILDMSKVYVGPELSLSMKLNNMVASTEETQASIQTLQQAVADADYASVTDLALLGAKTLDGTAWILDTSNIMVSEDVTLAQHLSTLVAEAAGSTASVTSLVEAVINPDGGAYAKAMLQLDVDGHVVGYSATNDGTTGIINFTFDSFNILHPGSLTPVFSVVGGVVKMTNVEIDTLKVGSVISDSIYPGAVTTKLFWSDSWGAGIAGTAITTTPQTTWAEFGEPGQKAQITTGSIPASSEVGVRFYVNAKKTGSSSDIHWFRLKRTKISDGSTSYVGDTVKAGFSGIPSMFTYEWTDYPPEENSYTYTIENYREDGISTFYNAKLIVDIGKR